MLQLTDVSLRIAGRLLIERASFTVARGERVALVGANGTGKTSLLRLIAGELEVESGRVALTGGWRLGRVKQEAPAGPEPLIDVVLAADVERSSLLAEAEQTSDGFRLAEIHDRLAAIAADAAPARAARILAGLGFPAEQQTRPVGELSGGWRMRVALAALLFAQPELLLLDEPTNHLDFEATVWLEGYLKSYPGALFIVSHDRELLNVLPQRILHLEAGRIVSYTGNYDTFERTRAEQREHTAASAARQSAERKRIQAFIDRFRYKASKARQAQSRIKLLARMEPIAAVVDARTTHLDFPTPETLSPPLLALDGVAAGYDPANPVLRRIALRLDPDDRIGLIGPNGNGKTTFLRLLANRLTPLAGKITKSPRLKVGYFAQDQADELDLAATPLLLMQRADQQGQERKHRAHLARFGLDVARATTEVGKLSGGEKARLLFALVTREAPNVLLLDEPTNHLDIDARQALVQALNEYEGAVILVSHDPNLLQLVADRLWLAAEGTVATFEGDLEDYRAQVLAGRRGTGERRVERPAVPAAERKEQRRTAAETRAGAVALKRAVSEAEARLEKLAAAKAILEKRLADPAAYQGKPDAILELQSKHAEITAAIGAVEAQWLAAQAALEEV